MATIKTKSAAKTTSATKKSATKPATTSKAPAKAKAKTAAYTQPELREKLKDKIKAGDKGGRSGQWSARKAQLLATEYKKEGGDYKEGGKTEGQKHLESWGEEKWQTADGKQAIQGKTTSRYLPKKAWDKLSPAERKATDEKKKKASRKGEQFVVNTAPAKKARKAATKKS